MVKVILHGCSGKMGRVISALIKEESEMEIVAGVDKVLSGEYAYPVGFCLRECRVDADVVIDFSDASAVEDVLEFCAERNLPLVLCTTGLTEEQIQKIEETAQKIAILRSANMSLGISLLMKLVKDAAAVLAPAGFDIELVEKHHNQKVDAPSGTAIAFADAMNGILNQSYEYQYDRSKERRTRKKKEIGIVAVRGGTMVGEHDIIFAGEDEVLTFQHTAYSKAVFGKGAIEAAKFLVGKSAGKYDMSDVIQF